MARKDTAMDLILWRHAEAEDGAPDRARALTGVHASWPVKKGAAWWLRRRVRDGEVEVTLRAVIGPDLV